MNRLAIIILLAMAASLLACAKKREFTAFSSGPSRFEIATDRTGAQLKAL